MASSGTTNAMWRVRSAVGSKLVIRLPLRESGISGLQREIELLPELASTSIVDLVQVPTLVDSGLDTAGRPWALLDWLDGADAWTSRDDAAANGVGVAIALANVVQSIGGCRDLPAPERRSGARGGPLEPILAGLERWLSDPEWSASSLIDVAAVRRIADACSDVDDEPVESTFVHGDLIAGNLLLCDGALSAVIDWGGAGCGDPAQDLAPAWSMFDGRARDAFREAMDADDASWLRATAFELEHAVGGVLYYVPRRHTLGDVMARTLDRILAAYGDGTRRDRSG